MNSDYSKELLRTGIIEAKAGNKETARRYFDRAIYMSGSHDVLAEAWFWMGEITDASPEKRKALENCLSHDLRHARARRAAPAGGARRSGRRRPAASCAGMPRKICPGWSATSQRTASSRARAKLPPGSNRQRRISPQTWRNTSPKSSR